MAVAAQPRVNHFVQHRGADFAIRGMVRHVHVHDTRLAIAPPVVIPVSDVIWIRDVFSRREVGQYRFRYRAKSCVSLVSVHTLGAMAHL